MASCNSHGYVYVKGWEDFQHPDALRSSSMPWLKLHTSLLGNDAWLGLSAPDRVLLQGLWMLTARYGYGRLNATPRWLAGQLNVRKCSLDRLVQAGFIEIRASKAASTIASKVASLEVEVEIEKEARASQPQAARAAPPSRNGHKDHLRVQRISNTYKGVLLENGEPYALEWLEENHPDLVGIVAGVKPASKETA